MFNFRFLTFVFFVRENLYTFVPFKTVENTSYKTDALVLLDKYALDCKKLDPPVRCTAGKVSLKSYQSDKTPGPALLQKNELHPRKRSKKSHLLEITSKKENAIFFSHFRSLPPLVCNLHKQTTHRRELPAKMLSTHKLRGGSCIYLHTAQKSHCKATVTQATCEGFQFAATNWRIKFSPSLLGEQLH